MGSKRLWKWSLATNSFSAVLHSCKSKHSSNTHRQKLHQERQQPCHSLIFSNMQTLGTSAGPALPRRQADCPSCQMSNTTSDHRIQFQSQIPSVSPKTWTILPCVTSLPALLEGKHKVFPVQVTELPGAGCSARGPSSCSMPLQRSTFWAGVTT